MRTALFAFAAALGCALAAPAAAQDDPAAPAAAPAVPAPVAERICELHVWPTDAVRSTYSGWFHGGIVDGAVQGRDGYKKLPDSILTPEAQVRTLGDLDLPALMQLPGYTVVLHPERLPSRVIRATPGRLVPGTPDCYAELVTDDVFFQQDLVDGRFLKAIFRYRQFSGGDAPSRTFGSYVQYRVTQFPPQEPEQLDAALEEFRLAYGQAVREFGEALHRPDKKKKKAKKST